MALALDDGGTRADLLAIPSAELNRPHIAPVLFGAMDVFDAPAYWWTGTGEVRALSQTFLGFGEMVGVSEIQLGHIAGARFVDFEIRGDVTRGGPFRDLTRRIQAEPEGIVGRECRLFLGFADLLALDGLALLCPPITLFKSNVLSHPRIRIARDRERQISRITVTAEGPLTRVRKPGNGRLTDAAQKVRAPGDRGLEYVAPLAKNQTLEPGWTR
ncbi:hypothetical protein [Thalassococcus sp. S3]|uniref:hypothetical protein n=1 Tax=Thalassococcus sp. S3 TaxID=2017482 RepID=UPI001023F90E|nr:hypothetical protein [Thalassococcus sp. S3]QBF32140.1 hypothetical protein CFI11_13055 [Thalassococcus sp. S3]